MKLKFLIGVVVVLSGATMIFAQPSTAPGMPLPPPSRVAPPGPPGQNRDESQLAHFDLDFPGGTPAELLQAIEKASGVHVNAVIPIESANTGIPPLKMKNVTVPRLFEAIQMASVKTVTHVTGRTGQGNPTYQQYTYNYGFQNRTMAGDETVWYFHTDKPTLPPEDELKAADRTCRFYQLSSYLDRYKVEDITTALKTAWDMLGDKPDPEMTYHKDTQLLIAVGTPDKLKLIDDVLKQLALAPTPGRGEEGASPAAQPGPAKPNPPARKF
jgi:hypothetical protein